MATVNCELIGNGSGPLHELNRRRILEAVRTRGASSRAELGRLTGLARGTVATIVMELCAEGILHEAAGARAGVRGRPPVLVSVAPPARLGVVVDVGHEHATVAVGTAEGRIVAERVAPFPAGPTPAGTLAVAAGLLKEVVADHGLASGDIHGSVLSLPGSFDAAGNSISRRFRGMDLAGMVGLTDLRAPVSVMNDANLAALGEAAFGAGRSLRDFLYVKMSRGIGAGLVLGGRLYHGSRGLAGNVGHLRVRENGARCGCGNTGCLQTVVSARNLVAALRAARRDEALELEDLLGLAADGDPDVQRLAVTAGRETGRILATVINAFNPTAVLVGGCLTALGEPLFTGLRESITRHGQPLAVAGLTVRPAACGRRGEIFGGLALAHGMVATTGG
jgi:predicted NBD/HSP70 family sugar kinase